MAGSRGPAPYTVVEDLTTSLATPDAFWQAASSCMVPMTLISFIDERPPALPGVATTPVWTTVSTPSAAITFAITGLRMSARTNRTRPSSARGGTTSTPSTVPIAGSSASLRAQRAPASRETPVTITTCATSYPQPDRARRTVPAGYLPSLRRCTRVFFSSLRCFFFAIRLRRFLITEPTSDHPNSKRTSAKLTRRSLSRPKAASTTRLGSDLGRLF